MTKLNFQYLFLVPLVVVFSVATFICLPAKKLFYFLKNYPFLSIYPLNLNIFTNSPFLVNTGAYPKGGFSEIRLVSTFY